MSLKDQLVDIPAQCGVGVMHIAKYRFPIPIFTVNFGVHAEARTEQFLRYKNIALSITEVSKFLYIYAIHNDELFYETKDGTIGRRAEGEEAQGDETYGFSLTHNVSRRAHKMFADARAQCGGQWVLLIRTNVVLFLLMNAHGNVLGQEIRPLKNITGIDWKDPPA